jgi:hypothetical protein
MTGTEILWPRRRLRSRLRHRPQRDRPLAPAHPTGLLYANLEAGDIELPGASIAGFADVLALMLLSWWLMHRNQHKHRQIGHRRFEPGAKPDRRPVVRTARKKPERPHTAARVALRRAA